MIRVPGWMGLVAVGLFGAWIAGSLLPGGSEWTVQLGAVLLICVPALGLYMLPAIVARHRGHPQAQAITVLTVVGGWTLAGWIVALVWAAMAFDCRKGVDAGG